MNWGGCTIAVKRRTGVSFCGLLDGNDNGLSVLLEEKYLIHGRCAILLSIYLALAHYIVYSLSQR